MTCSIGARSKLLIDDALPFDSSSIMQDFLWEDISKKGRVIGAQGIAGTRSQYAARTRIGTYIVNGRLSMYSCASDYDVWLPKVLGKAEVSDVFDVDDTLPSFQLLIHKDGGIFQYEDCVVSKYVMRAKGSVDETQFAESIYEIIAKSETADDEATLWPASPPSLSTASNRIPYILSDATLTIGGSAYEVENIVMVIDNHVQPRFVNSLTASELCPQDRTVMLRIANPFTSTEFSGLYKNASRGDGVSATFTLDPTSVAVSTIWAFEGLQWAQKSPVVRGKQEIPLFLDFIARKTGSAGEVKVTNDSVA